MYEKPKLVEVGKVERVVLGWADFGTDLDGTDVVGEWGYADDDEEEFEAGGF